jgi:hypothetical protein
LTIVLSGSLEAEPLKATVWPTTAGLGDAVKDAVGGMFDSSVMVRVVKSVLVLLSVTLRCTSMLPSVV